MAGFCKNGTEHSGWFKTWDTILTSGIISEFSRMIPQRGTYFANILRERILTKHVHSLKLCIS
jgi:hypothetical protein